MGKKTVLIALFFVLALNLPLIGASPAYAACRDDCYSSCCGDDGLCNGEGEDTCLAGCLADCGGEDVPDVPEPTPADDPEPAPADDPEPAPDDGGSGGEETGN